MIATLVAALAAAMLLAWTAYLGGRINHPELREDPRAVMRKLPAGTATVEVGLRYCATSRSPFAGCRTLARMTRQSHVGSRDSSTVVAHVTGTVE